MDIGQGLGIFAAGITATLGTIKLIRFIARDREEEEPGEHERIEPQPDETVKQYKERLFPNGEKDRMIGRIDELVIENRDRRREILEVNSTLRDISARLEKHGI